MSLHQHLDLSPLLALLSEHLPTSLPTYNCLLCDDVPRVFASFAPGEEPVTPWVVLAELGTTQLRIFCSLESSSLPSEEELRTAAVLVGACVRDYARVAPEGLEEVKLGAVNELWISMMEGLRPLYLEVYDLHLGDGPRDPSSTSATALPAGLQMPPARLQDVEAILSTSSVAHSPTYISSRLSHSSAVIDSTTSTIVAHCFTHRDGSIGTVHVNATHRRLGLARAIMDDRVRRESTQSFSYVSSGNAESKALMKSMRWDKAWRVAWMAWRRSDLETRDGGAHGGLISSMHM